MAPAAGRRSAGVDGSRRAATGASVPAPVGSPRLCRHSLPRLRRLRARRPSSSPARRPEHGHRPVQALHGHDGHDARARIVIALDAIKAPKTVNNFVFLALHHYYDGVIFHRIITGSCARAATRPAPARGGPGYKFEDELPEARPVRDRFGGDGQRRPEHERQPVLHRERPAAASACRRSTRCSARSSRASTWSRPCRRSTTDRSDRPARTSSSTRSRSA